jgi:hypothetical protein
MTQISIRSSEHNTPVFNAISSILMGAIVVAAGALSFVVFLTA